MLGHYFDRMNKPYEERYYKSLERIVQIVGETKGQGKYDAYFNKASNTILKHSDLLEKLSNAYFETQSFEELKTLNRSLYEDVLEDNYEESFANPKKCVQDFGKEIGQNLCYIYTRILNNISFVFEGQKFKVALNNELLIKTYEAIIQDHAQVIKQLIFEEAIEAIDFKTEVEILRRHDPEFHCYSDILISSDLKDLRYLFHYGLYICEDEIKTAEYLMTLSEEKLQKMADVFTNAFYKGYMNGNKEIPLSKKSGINMAYPIGFERVVRKAVDNFMIRNLNPIVYSDHFTVARPRIISTPPNQQYSYDHRFDEAIFYCKEYTDAHGAAYAKMMEKHSDLIRKKAGIALQESFGKQPFSPTSKDSSINYNEEQTNLKNEHTTALNKTGNHYLPGSAWSFVIICYPLPSIGEHYKAIFDDIIAVNTLDSNIFEKIQKSIIDALDLGEYVHVLGKGENKTDILVKLHELNNPDQQTNFENCTADMNVPVGEVYTSPVLSGTTGIIHVSQVYLYNLKYENLQISFKDGMIDGYNCSNFSSEEENKKFVHENLMHPHKTLPLGEFAIGTNTKAYVMAKKYNIEHVLPILIVEKMGPHFAIGDTCFAWSEDIYVCNSDGKEIIARDNEKTLLRKSDLDQAYTYKHTDITIPYEELKLIAAITQDGSSISIIEDGRFVLPGTEILNEPFNK